MRGWKTWAAGLGGIFSGLSMVAFALSAEPVEGMAITDGITLIIGGLGIIGIGHKIEKAA